VRNSFGKQADGATKIRQLQEIADIESRLAEFESADDGASRRMRKLLLRESARLWQQLADMEEENIIKEANGTSEKEPK